MSDSRLALQTVLLPGRDLIERFSNARASVFDAVEYAVRTEVGVEDVVRLVGAIPSDVPDVALPKSVAWLHEQWTDAGAILPGR
ncbi:MAG TPA: hypothetical protein VD767_02675 [Thermomicrobiales bacterium]|nr:hypothetical protein [Thermomicrobiales bacterium]